MSQRIVVAGTDTEIGKTVFAAGLADLLGANYWKPIQAGLKEETDSHIVARLGGLLRRPHRTGTLSPANAGFAASGRGN